MSHFFEFAVSSLLQTAWQSAVLVAIVLVLQWILRGRMPARWHAALWLVVLARLLVPAVPQSPASVFNLAHLAAWNGPALPETNGQFEQLPIAPDGTASDPAQNDTISAIPFPAAANSNGPASPVSTTAAPHASGWLRVVGGIWLAGAFILLVRVATMSLRLRTTLRRCRTVDDPRLLALLDDCRSQMHVARPVALLASPETVSPAVTASSRRAWIIVPESLLGELNPGELRLMLLHELAHLRRWDVLQQWLWTIAATLHWFNPIVWLAVRRMQADREIACDETVLACLDSAERLTYGRAILKVVETLSPVMPLAPAVGALDSASNLNRRILMIARYRRTSRLWTPSALLLVLGLCAIGLTDAVDKPVSAASAAAAAPVEAATVPSEQTQPPSTSAKGKLYVDALLRMTDPQGEKQVQGIIEVDPETGAWRKLVGGGHGPRVSPDGQTLLFFNDNKLMTCDTRDALSPGTLADIGGRGSWLPNGRSMVVTTALSTDEKEIDSTGWRTETWQINSDGTPKTLLAVPSGDFVDDVSPDGNWFVTSSDRHVPHGSGYQLYLMRPDGTGQKRLTKSGLNVYARFSPDSKQIAYLFQNRNGNILKIVNIDGTDERPVLAESDGANSIRSADWSPDGKRLAVVRFDWQRDEKGNRSISDPANANYRIEIADADGNNVRIVPLKDAKVVWMGSLDWQ